MASKVKPEQFQKALEKYLDEYAEEINKDVRKETKEAINTALNVLKRISPKDTRRKKKRDTPYAEGWTVKTRTKGKERYSRVIWNATNYQLTHILEFGHATKNGGRVPAQPHIRKVEQKYKQKFKNNLEKDIRR